MKDGAVVAELPAAEADVHTLHRLMVGRGLQAEYYREPLQRPFRDEVWSAARGPGPATAPTATSTSTLHAGEILGIAGVIGSGREELTRTLAGFAPHDDGTLDVFGAEVGAGLARPTRSTMASATSRASGAPRAWSCSCRWPPTSRWRAWASCERLGLIDTARRAPDRHRVGRAAAYPHARRSTRSASTSRAATSRRWCWPSG